METVLASSLAVAGAQGDRRGDLGRKDWDFMAVSVKLRELGARLFRSDGEPADSVASADYLEVNCPGCSGSEHAHPLILPLKGSGQHWDAAGSSIDDITFVPRKVGGTSVLVHCRSEWHGWILDGQAVDWQPGD